MKPSIRTTGLAFLLLGAGLAAWGFVGLIPSPTFIGGGAAVALTGVGLFFRARLAHRAGLVLSTAATGLGGWNLYHAIHSSSTSHLAIVKAGVLTAVSLYLLVSLVWVRPHFRRAKV
jgi:hypothetical protein